MPSRLNAVKTSFFGKGAVSLLIPELKKMKVQIKRIDASVFELFDRVPPRPKGKLSRYLEESIKKVVDGE